VGRATRAGELLIEARGDAKRLSNGTVADLDISRDESSRWPWGRTVPKLAKVESAEFEHEQPDEPPRRPRMCHVCQRLRRVERAYIGGRSGG